MQTRSLFNPIRNLLQARWQSWLKRRHPQGGQAVRLTQNRVYIFLARGGIVFIAILLTMLGGAINYDLALAYLLIFLLAAMGLVSIFHTFRNLLGLELSPGRVEPAFVGGHARFEIMLRDCGQLARHNVQLAYGEVRTAVDVPAGGESKAVLVMPAPQRGWLVAPRLRIESDWPLGVFRSWSYAFFAQRVLVYPAPEAQPPNMPLAALGEGQGVSVAQGQDDFSGLRDYQSGDALHHIAWKTAARSDKLAVKLFSGEATRALWLDWDSLPNLETEPALSRLCAWVLQAHAEGLKFGLRLPGRTIEPAVGEDQRDACLAALALYGLKEAESA